MSLKTTVVTESAESFLARAKGVARQLDKGAHVAPSMTISYGDPAAMFSALSNARRKLLNEVLTTELSIQQLTRRLHRERSAVAGRERSRWAIPAGAHRRRCLAAVPSRLQIR